MHTITLGVGYRVYAMQWQELVCCLKFMEDKEVRELPDQKMMSLCLLIVF